MRNFFGHLAATISALALSADLSSAQIFSPLHTFATASGFDAPLTQGPDGVLYGVSSAGGLGRAGTVFRFNPDGTHFAILHSFGAGFQLGGVFTNADGYGPVGALVVSNNVLYGTTKYGGVTGYGTAFKINTDGSGFSTLHFFTNGIGGGTIVGGLALGAGALYGVAYSGGTNGGNGTVFALNTDGTGFTNLHFFGGTNGTFPMASMILSGSTLYGTTQEGNNGSLFKIDTNGLNFSVLHHFTPTFSGTNIDGDIPEAELVLSGSTLYGTASGAGLGHGTLFAMSTDGAGFTNLYNFTNGLDGATPAGGLALSGNTLYGTAKSGGVFPGRGTIFKINTDGTGFAQMYDFGVKAGANGTAPAAALLLSGDTLFGTAGSVVFSINTGSTNITVLANGSDGAMPMGGLVRSGNTFYGTTSAGGASGSGSIYQVNTNGTGFDALYTFSAAIGSTNSDGASPRGTLVLSGGKLYGTANSGGSFGFGTIFCINTNGTGFTNFHSFTNALDGKSPTAGLVLGGATLYGTTPNGGISNAGTIFKINIDGSGYATLYSFSGNFTGNTDGFGPRSGLVLSGNMLYGTAYYGGTGGSGTLFKVDTNGENFSVLYNFISPINNTDTNNVNGINPVGGLIISGDTLYGANSGGGEKGKGSTPGIIFKINTDGGGFTRLHSFAGNFGGTDPMAAMVLSGNLLYGTASTGGNGTAGTVFQMDTNGNNFATIHAFAFQGGTPAGDLVVVDGVIYGTSEFSVPGSGFVFAVTPTGPPTIPFIATPSNGAPPTTVQFDSPMVDNFGNPIIYWKWNFGDGTNSTAQNPSHTYSNNITYIPTLTATNNNGAEVVGVGPAIVLAYPSSILNGGFEAGSFTNWTRTGNFGLSSVSTTAQYRHSGTYGAQLYAASTLGYLSQTLTTIPGSTYLVSLWLDITNISSANEFSVTWGGNVLMDETNIPKIGWTNIQFFVAATTGTSTILQLGYRNDSAYFGLDDVSVVPASPVITGFAFAVSNLVLTNSGGISNRSYIILSSTNPALPFNEWIPVTTNVLGSNGNFSITATNVVSPNTPREFFILQMK